MYTCIHELRANTSTAVTVNINIVAAAVGMICCGRNNESIMGRPKRNDALSQRHHPSQKASFCEGGRRRLRNFKQHQARRSPAP